MECWALCCIRSQRMLSLLPPPSSLSFHTCSFCCVASDRCLLYLSMQIEPPDSDPQNAYSTLDQAVRHLVQLGEQSEAVDSGGGQGENGHPGENGFQENANILCKVFYVHTIHSFEDESAGDNGIHCCPDCSLSSDYTDAVEAAQVLVKRYWFQSLGFPPHLYRCQSEPAHLPICCLSMDCRLMVVYFS